MTAAKQLTTDDLLQEAFLRLAAREGLITPEGELADADAQWRAENLTGNPITLAGRPLHHYAGLDDAQLASMGVTRGEVAAVQRLAGPDTPIAPPSGTPAQNLRDALLLALCAAVLGTK